MSIASVMVAPMPTAAPLIAAITGLGHAWIASATLPPVSRTPSWYGASVRWSRRSAGVGSASSSRPKTLPSADRSMPAQNARPEPVTTIARIASSVAAERKKCSSSRAMVTVNALRDSGRSRVSVQTPSSSVVDREGVVGQPCRRHPRGIPLGVHRSVGDARRVVLADVGEELLGALLVPGDGEVLDRHAAREAGVAVDPRHREGEASQRDRAGALAHRERPGRRHGELVVAHRVEEGPHRQRLVADRRDDLALGPGAVDVAELGVGLAGAGVAEGGLAVGLLAALRDVEVGVGVLHRGARADLHTTHGVDHADEAAEADLDVVVDADAGLVLEGADEQLGAAVGEGGVDLVALAVARDRDDRVAGDRHQHVGAVAGVEQHDRVGALPDLAAGAELLALRLGEVVAGVGAHDQVGVAALLVGAALVAGHRVDLVDLAPRPEGHGEHEDEPHQHEQLDDAEAEARAAPLLLGPRRGSGRGGAGRAAGRSAAAGRRPRLGGHDPRLVRALRLAGATPGGDHPGGVGRAGGGRALAALAVEPVVLGGPFLGTALPGGTFSHGRDATVRA